MAVPPPAELRAPVPRLPGAPWPAPEDLDRFLSSALAEDVGAGDLTSEAAVPEEARARGRLVAKAPGVLAGLEAFARVFELLDPEVTVALRRSDGDAVEPGDAVAELEGRARALLVGERTALNVLARLSGVATWTRRHVEAAARGGPARVLDTRKTTPGMRLLEKYAVRCGGGHNHRLGLWDEAMVKDNHRDASSLELADLVRRLRAGRPGLIVTVEARDEEEALAAIAADADVCLLDNRTPEELEREVPRLHRAAGDRARPLLLEASGGVDLETIEAFAGTGVDRVSVGGLTHSAPALDLSLRLEVAP